MPKLRCSDAANGNGPFRLHAAVDVRIQPGAQFQSGGRPLRRLLEPHQRQVSGLAAGGFWARGGGDPGDVPSTPHLHESSGFFQVWLGPRCLSSALRAVCQL